MTVDTQVASTRRPTYPLGKRNDLQGMRAFAVLAVFADHLFGWPSGGFVGVDVFFVLSGFFITGLLIKERARTGELSFRNFYIRRVRRIIPSAVLVAVVTVVASQFLLTEVRSKNALIDGLWATVFLSNWRFERVGTDYFAQGQPPSPLLHYWSLSIEEQFYFVWPILLIGLFALTRRYSKGRQRYPAARQAWLATAMAAICAASFVLCYIQAGTGAYFSTLTRVWELGVGALLAICIPLLSRIPDKARPWLSYLGFAGAVASLFAITPATLWPGPWTLLPVLSTAVVISAFIGADARAVPHVTNPVAEYVGAVSYTLYLWHWPVIVLLTAVLPRGITFYVAAIVITAVLTVGTYQLYENPIRRSQWLDTDHIKVWTALGLALALTAFLAAGLAEVNEKRAAGAQQNQTLDLTPEPVDLGPKKDPCVGVAALTAQGCALYDPDKPLKPSLQTFADDTQGAYECYRVDGGLKSCTYGYANPDMKRIAIVGDSHAAMLLPALSPHLKDNKWQLTTFVGRGCQWMLRPNNNDCGAVLPDIQNKLLTGHFDLVIVTSMRSRIGDDDASSYVATWRPVAETGTNILAVGDNPTISPDALACLTRVTGNPGDCATPRDVALHDPDAVLAAANQISAATLDVTDLFCTADKCPAVIGNVIVYRDASSHTTATYAKTLSPQLVQAVKQALS